jgi:uncharacterized iron-regulated membrane protein
MIALIFHTAVLVLACYAWCDYRRRKRRARLNAIRWRLDLDQR